MPGTPIHIEKNTPDNIPPQHHYAHIGLRKIKSLLAIAAGFGLWQLLRLLLPGLEVHPLFIYMYGMIEIRETSDKTIDYSRMRIRATFVAILAGLPILALTDLLKALLSTVWVHIAIEIFLLLIGVLLILMIAEAVHCDLYCGLAASIFIILMVTHINSSQYLYSIMRAFQTLIGVFLAWLINVKLFPYPLKPGSLGYFLRKKLYKRFPKFSPTKPPKDV